jgi:hypothetical protein
MPDPARISVQVSASSLVDLSTLAPVAVDTLA